MRLAFWGTPAHFKLQVAEGFPKRACVCWVLHTVSASLLLAFGMVVGTV